MKTIICEGLIKKYKDKDVLKNVDFSVEGNGCVGFLGRNGAGKTSTIRILAGLSKITSGKVEVVGYDVNKSSQKIRKQIGYCPQIPTFYDYMTPLEWMCWVGKMFCLDKGTIESRSEKLLKKCGVWDVRNRKIGQFSGGMKQRLAIAQALINEPKLLILDEPVSALDPIGRYDVLKLIEELKSKMAIFVSTHIIDDIDRVADQIIIINDGVILANQSRDSLLEKYSESIIEIGFDHTDKDIKKILSKIENISNIQCQDFKYKVSTSKKIEVSREILNTIIKEDLRLISYSEGKVSLEDIFLRMVNK